MENMMPKGIRSYGPGKFNTIIDSYAFELTGDGVDEEASYPDGGGWWGLVRIDHSFRGAVRDVAEEGDDALTPAELTMLETAVAVVFHERSDGIVESDWYDNIEDANEAWTAIEEEVNSGYEDDEEEDEG
jgi:hypothetical protein